MSDNHKHTWECVNVVCTIYLGMILVPVRAVSDPGMTFRTYLQGCEVSQFFGTQNAKPLTNWVRNCTTRLLPGYLGSKIRKVMNVGLHNWDRFKRVKTMNVSPIVTRQIIFFQLCCKFTYVLRRRFSLSSLSRKKSEKTFWNREKKSRSGKRTKVTITFSLGAMLITTAFCTLHTYMHACTAATSRNEWGSILHFYSIEKPSVMYRGKIYNSSAWRMPKEEKRPINWK
jgi:hypothetical protein